MDYFHSRPLESPNFPPSGLSISQVCYCFSALHWSAPSGSHAQINSHSRPHHGPLRWVLTLFFFPRQSSDKRTLAQRPGSVRTTSQRPMFTADGPWLRAGPHPPAQLLQGHSRGARVPLSPGSGPFEGRNCGLPEDLHGQPVILDTQGTRVS